MLKEQQNLKINNHMKYSVCKALEITMKHEDVYAGSSISQ